MHFNILKKSSIFFLAFILLSLNSIEAEAQRKGKKNSTKCPNFIAQNGSFTRTSGAKCFASKRIAENKGYEEGAVCFGEDCAQVGETFTMSGTGTAEAVSQYFTTLRSSKITYS